MRYDRGMPSASMPAYLDALQAALPPDAVLTTYAQRLVYDCDAYTIDKGLPDVVVLPRTTAEVQAVMRVAEKFGVPVTPRGAGTGLSGGSTAPGGGLMISLARMNQIVAIDVDNRRATVQAGVVNLQLSQAVAPYGLHFAPDPSSQSACTIGGNVAENSGGPHTLKQGVTVNHVLAVEMVLADGEIIWLGSEFDENPGYDLLGAAIGTEGMLGVVTQAIVRLTPLPPAVRTFLAIFPSVRTASEAVSAIIGAGLLPAALEMLDQPMIRAVEAAFALGLPLDAGAALIIELDGLEESLNEEAEQVTVLLSRCGATTVTLAANAAEREKLWLARKKAIGAVGRLAPSKVTMDGVIPRTRLPEVLEAIDAIATAHQLRVANVFHAGDGNLHPILLFDERNPDEVERVRVAGAAILKACVDAGGSITGEHGVGMEKREAVGFMFTDADLFAMAQWRRVFDPTGRMNPHKVFPVRRGCGEGGPRNTGKGGSR